MSAFAGLEAFTPGCLEWLHRSDNESMRITEEDLAAILEANPGAVPDDRLRNYLVRALRGGLKCNQGRPPQPFAHQFFILAAEGWIREERDKIKLERALSRKPHRGELEPMNEAAERIAHELRPVLGPLSGRTLLNRISQRKRRQFVVSENPAA